MTDPANQDQALLSLDEELSRMAKDVPEMPESFRTGWREAVRREAAAAQKAETVCAEAARNIVPAARPARIGWIRGLSVAAAFVFLLGGALLGKDAFTFSRVSQTAGSVQQAGKANPSETASEDALAAGEALLPAASMAPTAGLITGTALPARPPESALSVTDQVMESDDIDLRMPDSVMLGAARESLSSGESALYSAAETAADTAAGSEESLPEEKNAAVNSVPEPAAEEASEEAAETDTEETAAGEPAAENEETAEKVPGGFTPANIGLCLMGLACLMAAAALFLKKK